MKQVTIKEVKKALNVDSNNELVLMIMAGVNALENEINRKGRSTFRYEQQWNALYDLLDTVGFYDDCKVVDK